MGIVSSLLGGALSSHYNAKAVDKQAAAQRELYQNRYQWTTADMEAAGLNPILAATSGGFGVSSASVGSAPSVDVSGGSSSYAQYKIARAAEKSADAQLGKVEVEKINADTLRRQVDNQGKQINALIQKYGAEVEKIGAEREYLGVSTAKTSAEIEQIEVNIENSLKITEASVADLFASANLKYSNVELNNHQMEVLNKTAEKIGVEIHKIGIETGMAEINANQAAFEFKMEVLDAHPSEREQVANNWLANQFFKLGLGASYLLPFTKNIKNVGQAIK